MEFCHVTFALPRHEGDYFFKKLVNVLCKINNAKNVENQQLDYFKSNSAELIATVKYFGDRFGLELKG